MSETLALTVETKPEELSRIAEAVEDLGSRMDWPPAVVFRVNLVLEEVSINIMNYAYDDGLHEFEITFTAEPDALTIEVVDDGRPFDPLSDALQPDVDAAIEDRSIGGLGIHLVKTMVDELSYRRERGKNRLTLVSRIGE